MAAGESDARLEGRLHQQQGAFSALSLDHAVAQMPRLQASAQLVFSVLSFTASSGVCVGL